MRVGFNVSKLTAKQEAFCLEIVAWSKESDGYRRAFLPPRASKKSINERTSRLRKTSKLVARIAELQAPVVRAAQFEMAQRLKELAYAATMDPADYFDEHGRPLSIREMPEQVRRAVAAYEVDPEKFVTNIKFVDKLGAIRDYSKLAGDIPNGQTPAPLPAQSKYDPTKLTNEEWDEYLRFRRKALVGPAES